MRSSEPTLFFSAQCEGFINIQRTLLLEGKGLLKLLPVTTKRLLLRRFQDGDLDAFHAYRSDPVVGRYQGWDPMTLDESRAFLVEQQSSEFGAEGKWLQVAVVIRDTRELIGDLGICMVSDCVGEIGFTLARKAQGHGYGAEAVEGLLGGLFSSGTVRGVQAITDTRNVASIALLKRVGFRLDRTARALFRGEWCDEHTFVLTHGGECGEEER